MWGTVAAVQTDTHALTHAAPAAWALPAPPPEKKKRGRPKKQVLPPSVPHAGMQHQEEPRAPAKMTRIQKLTASEFDRQFSIVKNFAQGMQLFTSYRHAGVAHPLTITAPVLAATKCAAHEEAKRDVECLAFADKYINSDLVHVSSKITLLEDFEKTTGQKIDGRKFTQ